MNHFIFVPQQCLQADKTKAAPCFSIAISHPGDTKCDMDTDVTEEPPDPGPLCLSLTRLSESDQAFS